MTANLWKLKLAAWLHDPAEKALVLMRDSENGKRIGHEQGSVATLRAALNIGDNDFDKRADHMAAAADRPNWPFDAERPRPAWANVHWTERPVLVHPLSGRELNLGKLSDVPAQAARCVSLDHFLEFIERDAAELPDHRLTFLAFWRFGPTPPADEIGALWQMLPADTRTPDHSIWQHLDAVSALSGAMAEDEPALLTVALGPVQGFIAQARSMADLWAGSHLLACLAWEAMKPIVKSLGPDAVLFPSLRGVPLVDLWLLDQAGPDRRDDWLRRFDAAGAPWLRGADSDENPLFSATLTNKFTALVPRSRARELAEAATAEVRAAALRWAEQAAQKVFDEAGRDVSRALDQVRQQLAGFPEVTWAAVDWPTAQGDDGLPAAETLLAAQEMFSEVAAAGAAKPSRDSFFGGELWQLLHQAELIERDVGRGKVIRRLRVQDHDFFTANAGVLYPAVHALSEQALAAAKACRGFEALNQSGYRCTVSGEAEWLAEPGADLTMPPGQRKDTVWAAVARERKAWAKPGEHLGALATLKRLWPLIFIDRLHSDLPGSDFARRPLSTHALALAPSIDRLIDQSAAFDSKQRDALQRLRTTVCTPENERTLLPRALARRLRRDEGLSDLARRLPSALELLGDADDDGAGLERLHTDLATLLGHRHETYYAAIRLDGDEMGAWLAGDAKHTLRFAESWHPQVRAEVEQIARRDPALARYIQAARPASPARHMAISSALNHFAQEVARHIVEDVCKGRLIYSGGDDVLALLAVDDVLPALLLLRAAYSGDGDTAGLPHDLRGLRIGRDHVMLRGRVLPTMGSRATASAGVVVAHHTAPLAHVLRSLDDAEKNAKKAGRNRFELRVMKRGGGEVGVNAGFWPSTLGSAAPPSLVATPAGLLMRIGEALNNSNFSRRAIYAASEWLAALPARGTTGLSDGDWRAMVAASLRQQFTRQKGLAQHADEAVNLACAETAGKPENTARYLTDMLMVAEFFGRQRRSGGSEDNT